MQNEKLKLFAGSNPITYFKGLHSTEKTARAQQKNNSKSNTTVLTLIVDKRANKVQINEIARTLLNTEVVSVRTAVYKGKTKNRGNRKGRRSDFKKAYVTVEQNANVAQVEAELD